MKLPLYVFEEEIAQSYEVTGCFAQDSETCSGIHLYAPGRPFAPDTLYVVPDQLADAFFEQRAQAHAAVPAMVYDAAPSDRKPRDNCLFCRSQERDFHAFFNGLLDIRDRCNEWDLRLSECNSRSAPYRDYVELCFPFFKNPIILYDHDYIIDADSRGLHPLPDDTDWINLTGAGYWIPEVRTTALLDMDLNGKRYPDNQAYYYDSNRFFHNFALMNLRENNRFFGTICVHEIFTPVNRSILFFINHLGLRILPRLREEVSQFLQAKDLFDRFLQSILLENTFSQDFINSRLNLVGWDETSKYCVIGFAESNDVLQSTYFPKRMQTIFRNCRTVPVGNLQVTVARLQNNAHLRDFAEFVTFIRDSVVKCGVSSILNSFSEITLGFRQAQAALELGNCIHPTIWMYEYEKYAIDYILKFALERESYKMLCHPAVLRLDAEDEAGGTCYIDTLEAYLTCEKNIGKIAEQLFIHRNSLMYRLEKITALTGINYQETDEMEHILLSIRILKLHRKHIFTPLNPRRSEIGPRGLVRKETEP